MESIRVALDGVVTNKLRSLLTTLGIVIGVAAVITLVSVGEGASAAIRERIQGLGSNLIMISPGATVVNRSGDFATSFSAASLTVDHADQLARRVPYLSAVAPIKSSYATVKWSTNSYSTQLVGSTPQYLAVREYQVAAGRFLTESDIDYNRRVAVIGQTVSEEVFMGRDPLGKTLMIEGEQYTVAGVLAEKGESMGQDQDDIVLIPVTTAQRLLRSVLLDSIYASVRSADQASAAVSQIESIMEQLLGRPDQVRVQSQDELLGAIDDTTRTLTLMLGAIAGISLVVGGIGIMNIMLVSVTERTREIGLRKAVGARRRHILGQFLAEALIISLAGGAVGVTFGIAGSRMIAKLGDWTTIVSGGSVLMSFGFAALVGVVFGLYPAIKASALDPIHALRYE